MSQGLTDVDLVARAVEARLQEWAAEQGTRSVCRLDGHDAQGTRLKGLEGAAHATKEVLRLVRRDGGPALATAERVLREWQSRRNPARGGLWGAYISGGCDALLRLRGELS